MPFAAHAETGPAAREGWRDGWDVIVAPRGLVVRRVPPARRAACTKTSAGPPCRQSQRRPPAMLGLVRKVRTNPEDRRALN